mmetsp:Transcript_21483/g.59771  ORF Transcript_21483/g.59771 Transcript_21483/m.59771 type:complete len:296 (-) Transcript_21483:134-1021(-)
MDPFGLKTTALAFAVATSICARAIKRKSLTPSGTVAAFAVGFLSVVTGLRGMSLLVFYQVATKATKYKAELKLKQDATAESSSQRGPSQVLACSALAVALGLWHAYKHGAERPIDFAQYTQQSHLACAILAHHATCLADTLASELGMLATTSPVLITQPWRTVPPGTNGGVTVWGTACSALGGFIIALATILWDAMSGLLAFGDVTYVLQILMFGSICGLAGSFFDSLLGAVVQETYWDEERKLIYHAHTENRPKTAKLLTGSDILNNEQVNLVSVAITTFLGGYVIGPFIFGSA